MRVLGEPARIRLKTSKIGSFQFSSDMTAGKHFLDEQTLFSMKWKSGLQTFKETYFIS